MAIAQQQNVGPIGLRQSFDIRRSTFDILRRRNMFVCYSSGTSMFPLMPAIGITGGICTGKSTFCECLRAILPTAKFFNSDEAAHALVEFPELKQEIREKFGSSVVSSDGAL